MKLSTFYTQVPAYLEYGWVCAPNAAGQLVAANTITTLTMDTEVVDAGGHGSIAANAVTLAAGTYAWEGIVSIRQGGGFSVAALISLYNATAGANITRGKLGVGGVSGSTTAYGICGMISGQFTLAAPAALELRLLSSYEVYVDNGQATRDLSTLSTAGADQRTTLKLWKLQ